MRAARSGSRAEPGFRARSPSPALDAAVTLAPIATDVLAVSLVGAATILRGLLTVAGGSSLARGSRLARNLLTAYLTLLVVLQILAVALTELDPTIAVALLAAVVVIAAVWIPPAARRYFARTAPAASDPSPIA